MQLDPIQLRVLGSLIEKEITTPENYPLSLNALINACNQRSSRDPVLDLDEEQVRQALHALEDLALIAPFRDARVIKYEHRARTVLNLRRDETALLCLLILRGPQTPGELRTRADRMYAFDDLAAVTSTLDRLAARAANAPNPGAPDPGAPDSGPSNPKAPSANSPLPATTSGPLVTLLPRQPGSREARYAHLLAPLAALTAASHAASTPQTAGQLSAASISQSIPREELTHGLASEVATLRSDLASLHDLVSRLEHRISLIEKPSVM